MKIEEYIENINLNNFEYYLFLNKKKEKIDFIEILNSKIILKK